MSSTEFIVLFEVLAAELVEGDVFCCTAVLSAVSALTPLSFSFPVVVLKLSTVFDAFFGGYNSLGVTTGSVAGVTFTFFDTAGSAGLTPCTLAPVPNPSVSGNCGCCIAAK